MKHSSRHQPCPVCGRNTDDKCRWNDAKIFCFYGDSFRPPNSLRVGDTAVAFGKPWRLVRVDGGFSGGSYMFAPYEEQENFRRFTPQQAREERLRQQEISRKVKERFSLLRKSIYRCCSLGSYEEMNLQDLRDVRILIVDAYNECEDLIKTINSNRAAVQQSGKLVSVLNEWRKAIGYQKDDLFRFVRAYLQ